jgi:uncharacterized cupredoxin-like copper-binding protein
MKRSALTVLAASVALGSALALAHGEKHPGAPKIDYAKAEEKPFGRAADPKKAKRTITVSMSDAMRFSPSEITVKKGEIVRFAVKNEGQVLHEMVLGTMHDLVEHAELMKKFPGMEHDEPHMAHIAAGKSGEMGWQFTKAGEFHFGCLIPGHFEAGMKGRIIVTER